MLESFLNWLFHRNEPTEDPNEVWAEWYQHCFEIYCSNCGEEAIMLDDTSDYIYSKRCPHCNARMRNASSFGYKVAIVWYKRCKERRERKNKR